MKKPSPFDNPVNNMLEQQLEKAGAGSLVQMLHIWLDAPSRMTKTDKLQNLFISLSESEIQPLHLNSSEECLSILATINSPRVWDLITFPDNAAAGPFYKSDPYGIQNILVQCAQEAADLYLYHDPDAAFELIKTCLKTRPYSVVLENEELYKERSDSLMAFFGSENPDFARMILLGGFLFFVQQGEPGIYSLFETGPMDFGTLLEQAAKKEAWKQLQKLPEWSNYLAALVQTAHQMPAWKNPDSGWKQMTQDILASLDFDALEKLSGTIPLQEILDRPETGERLFHGLKNEGKIRIIRKWLQDGDLSPDASMVHETEKILCEELSKGPSRECIYLLMELLQTQERAKWFIPLYFYLQDHPEFHLYYLTGLIQLINRKADGSSFLPGFFSGLVDYSPSKIVRIVSNDVYLYPKACRQLLLLLLLYLDQKQKLPERKKLLSLLARETDINLDLIRPFFPHTADLSKEFVLAEMITDYQRSHPVTSQRLKESINGLNSLLEELVLWNKNSLETSLTTFQNSLTYLQNQALLSRGEDL